jgi:hypothetical protein
MSKKTFKSHASSSRVDPGTGFGGFGTVFSGSTFSYLSELRDLSSITDGNVVVAFKNLLKKDSTTKTKGLEDLRSFVQSCPYEKDGGVEQPMLEAWVGLLHRKRLLYFSSYSNISIGQNISSHLNRQFSASA